MKKMILVILVMLAGAYPIRADTVWLTGHHEIVDGEVYGEIYIYNDVTLDILGGDIFRLAAYNTTLTDWFAGEMDTLWTRDDSIVNIFGGQLGGLSSQHNSVVNLCAYDIVFEPSGGYDDGWIYGKYYADDSSFAIHLGADTYVHVNIIPEPAKTYYVDADATGANNGSSWEDAFKHLQDALADANVSGDDIWVAEGTYRPDENTANPGGTGSRSATFQLKNGVGIYGGFAGYESSLDERDWQTNETILSGDIGIPVDNWDNSYHVVTGSNIEPNAILDGFTITAGNSAWSGGGGMRNSNSSPTVTNCTFGGNYAWFGGGMFNENSSPTLTNCTFSENSAANFGGGGMCNWIGSNPTLTNCTFSDNSAWSGGGMKNQSSSPTLTNCTFTGNSAYSEFGGGGLGGGMGNFRSSPTLTNCIFSSNSAETWGGGIVNYDYSNPTITNCTISENSANDDGGGMFNSESSPTVTNCILWGNTAPDGPQIYNYGTSSPTVTYCDVEGGYNGNINADPLFVDPPDNLRLSFGSPCIDAADNTAVPSGVTTDLDGNPRVINGRIDMGAYEAMVSCFGVNHVNLGTKAGKKGNKVEVKGTFDPASPIDFAVDDVTYTIDDGLDYMLTFVIPAGSFEPEGKPDKQKFRFHSAKGSQPSIKAKFDFLKCKFELKVKGVIDTSEITADTLAIVLQAGANIAQEIVELEVKGKKGEHLEYKRKPKFECCPEM